MLIKKLKIFENFFKKDEEKALTAQKARNSAA
jgi:hypothetical protein